MVVIKPLDEIKDKWASVTPGRAEYLRRGVETTTKDWAAITAGAEENWIAGVTDAAGKKLFSKGVKAAGTEKWKRKTLEVGVARFGPGVTAAKEDFGKGFAPYHDVISRVVLPAKGPRGAAQNYERVRVIGDALYKQRTGGT